MAILNSGVFEATSIMATFPEDKAGDFSFFIPEFLKASYLRCWLTLIILALGMHAVSADVKINSDVCSARLNSGCPA